MTQPKDNCWAATFSGGSFDLLLPKAEQVKLVDIAHMLSRIARFTGATFGHLPWNVAQHSILVEWLLPEDSTPETRLHALLHDAHEAYLGDLKRPVQASLSAIMSGKMRGDDAGFASAWWTLSHRIDEAVRRAFAIEAPTAAQAEAVKLADLRALFIEKDQLLAPCERDWGIERPDMPGTPLWTAPKLCPAMPDAAKAMFIERLNYLVALRHGVA